MNEPMNEIAPGLYLGDIFAARNASYLRENGVTSILSIARGSLALLNGTFADETSSGQPFRHLQIELDDLPQERLLEYLEEGVQFIDGTLGDQDKGGKILVHCMQGISRSCSFVVAYLIWKDGITLGEALAQVQEKRKARPNAGFYRQLVDWESRCKQRTLS
ncbi:hypothetical protein H072_3863 [Dactylellina haptotyla CBS 200.50]|uniref:Uncharacterized protein n=1 Tax=Dactylellina haptotyla (strain CBS 200.50) TaxID=1284197 RepID=S8AH34_DACHA|nr:hypothetical protein H072_3863 [Dactylellina haptotyla CBS 200.50]